MRDRPFQFFTILRTRETRWGAASDWLSAKVRAPSEAAARRRIIAYDPAWMKRPWAWEQQEWPSTRRYPKGQSIVIWGNVDA